MSVSYGFFNSINGDRRYDAIEMSMIFDGIIMDGVYQQIGDAFMVRQAEGMNVVVGTGRAWFNHTWTYNDALLPLEIEPSELVATRIDAVVLEVDTRLTARQNTIKVVTGPISSSETPTRPTLTKNDEDGVWQYPLAYITIPPGSLAVSQTNIVSMVGMDDCPFVTGPLSAMSINGIVAQWEAQFLDWFAELEENLEGNPVTNLQVQINRMKSLRMVTLRANGWSSDAPYTQSLPILGYRSSDSPFVQCVNTPASKSEKGQIQKQWNFVDSILFDTDELTATCLFEKPTIDLILMVKGR